MSWHECEKMRPRNDGKRVNEKHYWYVGIVTRQVKGAENCASTIANHLNNNFHGCIDVWPARNQE
jgi:hypothetical protein